MVDISSPEITGTIDQRFFLTPLNGPGNPSTYLDNFPPQVYTHSIDSRLVKFLYSLMGPAGLGWIQKNYLEARLLLEDFGFEGFQLDQFYGDPLRFGRILEETYQNDPNGLISREKWNEIKEKDARYRSRALNYVAGIKAGNTPLGMEYVAKSGLGHDAGIIENYKYLYDQHSDDPIGLEYRGHTLSTEEMIVIPRKNVPQSEVQRIEIVGEPTGGSIVVYFPDGDPSDPASIATSRTEPVIMTGGFIDTNILQIALESIETIGQGNVEVTGGPLPETPVEVRFINNLSYKDVPELQVDTIGLTGGSMVNAFVTTVQAGSDIDPRSETISARDKKHLMVALGHLKPMTTIVSFDSDIANTHVQTWRGNPSSSSHYTEVIRYVTGSPSVRWPPVDDTMWVEPGVEKKSIRAFDDLQYNYQSFHAPTRTTSYTEAALQDPNYSTDGWSESFLKYRSDHIGNFTNFQRAIAPHLNYNFLNTPQFISSQAVALYAEQLLISSSTQSGLGQTPNQLINGIYPYEYASLPGVVIQSDSPTRFWASKERTEGDDYIEIDFGEAVAINYLTFEISNKPAEIEISYDVLDSGGSRSFVKANLDAEYAPVEYSRYDVSLGSPWKTLEYVLSDDIGDIIFTRFLRIKFGRVFENDSPFVSQNGSRDQYSFEVRNLRAGRNIG